MKYKFNKNKLNKMIISSLFIFFLLLICSNLTFASEVNSGENFDKAIVLNADNKMNTGTFSQDTSVKFYKVQLNSAGSLNIQLKLYFQNEIKVEIYNSSQEFLTDDTCVYNKDTSYGKINNENYFESGVYYIKLQKMYSNGEGKYDLKVKFTNSNTIDCEPNNDINKAQKIAIQKKVTGLITFTDLTDYLYIDITNQKNLKFSIVPNYDTTLRITIYDKDGYPIDNGIASFSSKLNKKKSYEFLVKKPNQRYYIGVKQADNTSTGKYTIQTTADVNITSISLNTTNVSLNVGNTKTLKVITIPSNANEGYTFSSSNSKIATVNKKGKITAKKAGSTTITVKSKSGKVVKKCKVTVKNIKVKSVKLNVSKKTLKIGSTYTLKASISPKNATNKSVIWKSSNTTVAKVNSKGKVTALKPGSTTITVTTKDGSHKKSCKIQVVRPVTGVSLNISHKTIYEGQSFQLRASVKPSNASNKGVSYHSSNSRVAVVSASGKVTAKNSGSAVITVTTKDGSKKAKCIVTVKEKVVVIEPEETKEPQEPTSTSTPTQIIKIKDIYVDGCSISVGDSVKLSVSFSPKNATNTKFTYKSSNSKVATVSSNGVVKGISKGTVIITVTSSNGVSNFCSVVVK